MSKKLSPDTPPCVVVDGFETTVQDVLAGLERAALPDTPPCVLVKNFIPRARCVSWAIANSPVTLSVCVLETTRARAKLLRWPEHRAGCYNSHALVSCKDLDRISQTFAKEQHATTAQ